MFSFVHLWDKRARMCLFVIFCMYNDFQTCQEKGLRAPKYPVELLTFDQQDLHKKSHITSSFWD